METNKETAVREALPVTEREYWIEKLRQIAKKALDIPPANHDKLAAYESASTIISNLLLHLK
jgi:hypothetical protein